MVEGEGAAVVFVWGERLAYLLVVYKQAGLIRYSIGAAVVFVWGMAYLYSSPLYSSPL